MRKVDGLTYFWFINNFPKISSGYHSMRMYRETDCKIFRYKDLSVTFHDKPMGSGDSKDFTPPSGWMYPPPNTAMAAILNAVCGN